MSDPYNDDPPWWAALPTEKLRTVGERLTDLLEQVRAFHEDTGHGEAGASIQCDSICEAMAAAEAAIMELPEMHGSLSATPAEDGGCTYVGQFGERCGDTKVEFHLLRTGHAFQKE